MVLVASQTVIRGGIRFMAGGTLRLGMRSDAGEDCRGVERVTLSAILVTLELNEMGAVIELGVADVADSGICHCRKPRDAVTVGRSLQGMASQARPSERASVGRGELVERNSSRMALQGLGVI